MLKAANEKNQLEAVEENECSMIHWKRRKFAFSCSTFNGFRVEVASKLPEKHCTKKMCPFFKERNRCNKTRKLLRATNRTEKTVFFFEDVVFLFEILLYKDEKKSLLMQLGIAHHLRAEYPH